MTSGGGKDGLPEAFKRVAAHRILAPPRRNVSVVTGHGPQCLASRCDQRMRSAQPRAAFRERLRWTCGKSLSES